MTTVESTISWENLERHVRETPLLMPRDGELIYPYADAEIRLAEISCDDVQPTTFYVVRRNLGELATVWCDLAMQGYEDPLQLSRGYLLRKEDGKLVGLTPPIVEDTPEDGTYLLDGAHRVSLGRSFGRRSFAAVYISGLRADCPSYAFPNSWSAVRIVDDVPTDPAQKKHYRPNYRALYRDFSALNGSRLREA